MHMFEKELKLSLHDFKSIKTIYKQIPNILTLSRIIATLPINLLFFIGNVTGALAVSIVAFLTDAIDGPLARKLKVNSKFGAELDAISDKLLIGGIAIPIVAQNPIMILNIILEGLISITNIKARFDGKCPKSSMAGKIKTWILSLTILAGYFTSIYNLNVSLLTSALAITPALIAQTVTLNGYIKTNNKKKVENNSEIEDIYSSYNKNNKVKKKKKQKVNNKVIINEKVCVEDLYKLKESLINNEESKTNDSNDINRGHVKTKTFHKYE